jgi:hypothetical protein
MWSFLYAATIFLNTFYGFKRFRVSELVKGVQTNEGRNYNTTGTEKCLRGHNSARGGLLRQEEVQQVKIAEKWKTTTGCE